MRQKRKNAEALVYALARKPCVRSHGIKLSEQAAPLSLSHGTVAYNCMLRGVAPGSRLAAQR